MFKDIVLAVTPSEVCECAADRAIAYAKRFESKLHIVHVCGIEHGWGSIEHLEASGECERIKNNISNCYKDKLEDLSNYDVVVKAGLPHAELLRVVRKTNADLLVMGPHTKEHVERRAKMWGTAGSTLERVSQRASCPVMIVTRESDTSTFQTILVATDFTKAADCAVHYGGQLARHYKSELVVFNALDSVSQMDIPQDELDLRVEESMRRMHEHYDDKLRGIPEHSFECVEGKASTEILKMARIKDANLIIMAHHAKDIDPEKALLGSTVVQVALNSSCPTMSVNRHFDLRCGLMYDQSGEAKHVATGKSPNSTV